MSAGLASPGCRRRPSGRAVGSARRRAACASQPAAGHTQQSQHRCFQDCLAIQLKAGARLGSQATTAAADRFVRDREKLLVCRQVVGFAENGSARVENNRCGAHKGAAVGKAVRKERSGQEGGADTWQEEWGERGGDSRRRAPQRSRTVAAYEQMMQARCKTERAA